MATDTYYPTSEDIEDLIFRATDRPVKKGDLHKAKRDAEKLRGRFHEAVKAKLDAEARLQPITRHTSLAAAHHVMEQRQAWADAVDATAVLRKIVPEAARRAFGTGGQLHLLGVAMKMVSVGSCGSSPSVVLTFLFS